MLREFANLVLIYLFAKRFYYTVVKQQCGAVVCIITLSTKLHVSAL